MMHTSRLRGEPLPQVTNLMGGRYHDSMGVAFAPGRKLDIEPIHLLKGGKW